MSEFLWCAGIEDTFIATPHPETSRVLDEYLLTDHYERWREDLQLLAELGLKTVRYGIPWHRVESKPGIFDWEWTDRVLEHLVVKLGINPIVDLIHYGTPLWLEESFYNQSYPDTAARYARAFAERYKGICRWYTPLNEPRINAWFCGRVGWWPPYGRSWASFVKILLQVSRSICCVQHEIGSIISDATFVHVDASDLYVPSDASDEKLVAEAAKRQAIVYLALDLVMGRVDARHELMPWLLQQGVTHAELEWFRLHKVCPSIVGFNAYPMWSKKDVERSSSGRIHIRMRNSWADSLLTIAQQYAKRYQLPVMCTETALRGPMGRRLRWLNDSAATLYQARANGLDIVGYTFWPLFSIFTWTYQRGARHEHEYLHHMGLYDLNQNLDRLETVVARRYREIVGGALDAAQGRVANAE